jgi:hypothetical protein
MYLLIPREESQTRDLNFALLKKEMIIELDWNLRMKQIP